MTNHLPSAETSELPTREDVQELRQAIESLRDHVQIVWQAVDEVREVIEQVVGRDAAEFWHVEPPDGFPLGRYRPFAGYDPADEWNEENGPAVEPPPELDTSVADLSAELADELRSSVADCLRESRSQGGMDSLADPHRQNIHNQNGSPAETGPTHQRSLWNDGNEHDNGQAVSTAAPAAEAAAETSQKEAEPAAEFVRPDRQYDFGGLPQYEWPAAEHDRDSLSVDRIYTEIGTTHRFTIRRGDTVEVFFSQDRIETGKAVGISQANQEVRVQFGGRGEGIWFYKGKVYPAKEPGDIEQHDAEPAPTAAASAHETYSLDDYIAFRHAFMDGQVDAAGIHAEFRRLQAAKQSFVDELVKTKSADQLRLMAMQHGHLDARRNTKRENAETLYRSHLAAFSLGESIVYQPMQETYEDAIERIVMAITDESIASQREKNRQEQQAKQKALTNPESFQEYSQFVGRKGTDSLSDEQLATWDRLNADISRDARKRKQKDTVEQFESAEIGDVQFQIVEGWHDREQIPLSIVTLSARVERSTFDELKRKATQLSGWWSSFKKPAGFQFRSKDSAEKFAGLAAGDADRSDELANRKLRKMDNAAERLAAVAASLEEKAAEVLAADDHKLKNTMRRADMAASIRAQAFSDQADAKTLKSIAAALATGDATYLDGVWNAAQVRTLATILRQGRRERIHRRLKEEGIDRRKDGWSQRYDELEHEPLTAADARYATFPKPYLYRQHLVQAFAQLGNTPGVKKATAKMRKLVDSGPKDQDFVEFVNDYQVELLEDFLARAKAAGSRVWWFDHCLDNYKRLKSAHIDDNHELRTALRELVPHLAHAAGDDPVTKAEDELRGKELPGFFPTPRRVIEQMLDLAGIEQTHRILEPSCGKGDILDAIRREHPDVDLAAVEQNLTLQGVLTAKGFSDIVQYGDFLEHRGEYDRVLMNPPFEHGQDIDHIRHAFELLAPGGRIVAIASEGPFFRSDAKSTAFREWLCRLDDAHDEALPDDTFKGGDAFRQTGVKTRLVILNKP